MDTSLQTTLGPMELTRVGCAHPTAHKSFDDWRALVVRALGRAGLSQKEAASRLGVTQSALSKQLSGLEHLSFWRALSLGADFWLEAIELISGFYGLPPRGLTAQDEADRRLGKAFREAVQQAQR
jgi:transcriptional regulator with XRE-family HTH domain